MWAWVTAAAMVVLAGCTWPGAALPSVAAPDETVRVISVSDGDTFAAVSADGERVRIRLLGIDAPEAARDGQPAECGAEQAAEVLRALIARRAVKVAFAPPADPIRRVGRQLP